MRRAVLFDLEGTLVDVSAIDALRSARRWRDYVANVGKTRLYPGVGELLPELRANGVAVGVVTNVPSMLAEALLSYHAIEADVRVCFHDVPRGQHKPHPAMCTKALGLLGVVRERAVGVGDRIADCGAFHAAGLPSYCAGWNGAADQAAGWDKVVQSPREILSILPE